MKLKVLKEKFSICKVEDISKINFKDDMFFLAKTDEEISLVCETKNIPDNIVTVDSNWKGFRIEGILDFSLIGILSEISNILAKNNIGIFAISTYNTDYIFTKEINFKRSLEILEKAGYEIV